MKFVGLKVNDKSLNGKKALVLLHDVAVGVVGDAHGQARVDFLYAFEVSDHLLAQPLWRQHLYLGHAREQLLAKIESGA